MCGIAGIFNFSDDCSSLLYISRMTEVIKHRGPDDGGCIFFGDGGRHWHNIDDRHGCNMVCPTAETRMTGAIGHRRLSIIDLSPKGHQPMSYADQRYWLTYNGEIYNHIELRRELESKGHTFSSRSDTEVILAAYAEWGKDCLNYFNGMWAFVLVDLINNKLFAARDRFGVKPLYYWISPQGFLAFASEIKQFTVLPGWQAKMNGQRVYDFLTWAVSDHTQETLFKDVYQLRGGEAMEVNFAAITGKLPVYQWYKLTPQPFSGTFDEATEEFRRLMKESVELRLRADVPVGSCLSGGLDSSSIVCIVNDLLRGKGLDRLQKTFSACADVSRFDEREYIDEVVKNRAIEAHYTYPGLGTLFDNYSEITWHQDEPFGSTSIYAQWHVFALASKNEVKVILDGQGADELLAGYHSFFGPRLAGLLKQCSWFSLWREMQGMEKVHGYGSTRAAQYMANMLLPEGLRQKAREVLGKAHSSPEWLNVTRLGVEPTDPYTACGVKTATIQESSCAQMLSTSLPMLLHWEDRNSMAHSIESRVPFLDYRLVEFALGLPDEFKLSGGVTKRVLREGMVGILPEMIRKRMDKMGFVTPEEVWVRERDPDKFRAKLKQAIEVSHGILMPNATQKLERIINNQEQFSFWAWRLIDFGAWVERFGVRL